MSYLKMLQDARLMNDEPGDAGGAPAGTATKDPEPGTTPPPAEPPVFSAAQQEHINNLMATAVTSAVDATNTKRDGQEAGLKKNRDTLLKEKKDYQAKLKDNDRSQRMLDGDVEAVTKEIRDEMAAEHAEALKEMKTSLDKNVVAGDNEYTGRVLDTFLSDLKVKSVYQADLKIGLEKRSKTVKDENGVRSLLIDGKPAAEHFTAWSASEDAKNYVTVAPSSGGGGQGSSGHNSPSGSYEVLSKLEGSALIEAAYELKNKK